MIIESLKKVSIEEFERENNVQFKLKESVHPEGEGVKWTAEIIDENGRVGYLSKGPCLKGIMGRGQLKESALLDLILEIRGGTVVFQYHLNGKLPDRRIEVPFIEVPLIVKGE